MGTIILKKWFKDSKVVDEDGNPLVVYHGTDADFNAFGGRKGSDGFARAVGEAKTGRERNDLCGIVRGGKKGHAFWEGQFAVKDHSPRPNALQRDVARGCRCRGLGPRIRLDLVHAACARGIFPPRLWVAPPSA